MSLNTPKSSPEYNNQLPDYTPDQLGRDLEGLGKRSTRIALPEGELQALLDELLPREETPTTHDALESLRREITG